jgi:hypothetical protein
VDDFTPPVVSNIQTQVSTTNATVTWTTNEPATGEIDYGLTVNYGWTSNSLILSTQQFLVLHDLTPNTTYHFQIYVQDAAGNRSTVQDKTFTTSVSATNTETSATQTRLIDDNGTFYLISNGEKHGVTNPGMLFSYGFEFKDAKPASPTDSSLPVAELLLPGNGALVKSESDPTVWLISDNQKHGFISQQIFLAMGFKFSSVLIVTAPELNKLDQGNLITDPSIPHPNGVDINYQGTIYWLTQGKKYGFPSMTVYNSWRRDNDFSQVVPANAADAFLPLGGVVSARVLD